MAMELLAGALVALVVTAAATYLGTRLVIAEER
jgi:hypothetical protein